MPFPKGHALLIGVGTHQHCPWLDLQGTAADAEAVAKVLQDDDSGCGYATAQVRLLTHSSATKGEILAALDDLAGRTGAGDIVFLFFCGHGALGTDDSYYLAGYDVRMEANRVQAPTGVGEKELLAKVQAIRAEHVLVVFNACHGGTFAPARLDAAAVAATALTTGNPPEDTVAALLGTGRGRIVVAACRTGQRSHAAGGRLSLFAQALVDGLRGAAGAGTNSSSGFLSAYGLYSYLYASVAERARTLLNEDQEPELAVLRGARSFAIAQYKGASTAGVTETAAEPAMEPLPQGTAVREISPEESAHSLAERFPGGDELHVSTSGEDGYGEEGGDLADLDDTDFVIGNIRK
jgi:hypothetical protein